jgi:hypothetical protein
MKLTDYITSNKEHRHKNRSFSEADLLDFAKELLKNAQNRPSFLMIGGGRKYFAKRVEVQRLKHLEYPLHYPKHIKPRNRK